MSIYPQLENMCRLCLAENAGCINIFERDKSSISIPVRIMACAALEVHDDDGLPTNICKQCRYYLETAYLVRKRSLAADSKLRKHLRLLSSDRKSRIFDTISEDDDDELEFEESIQFIKGYNEELYKSQREEWELIAAEEINRLRAELKAELSNCSEFRKELKEQLRSEVESALQLECMEKAKTELRSQLTDECRRASMSALLDELQEFINSKHNKLIEMNENNIDSTKSRPFSQIKTYSKKNTVGKIKRNQHSKTINCSASVNNFITEELQQAEPPQHYGIVSKINSKHIDDSGDDNFYIVETIGLNNVDVSVVNELSESLDTTETEQQIYQIESGDFKITKQTTSAVQEHDDDARMDCDATAYEIHEVPSSYKDEGNTGSCESAEADEEFLVLNLDALSNNDDADNLVKVETPKKQRILKPRTDLIKTFKCTDCTAAFTTENKLKTHQRQHIKVESNGISSQCHYCKTLLSCKSSLKRHMLLHTGERPYVCNCCNKSFAQREILRRHMVTHTGDRPFKCSECERSFTQKICLTQHMKKMHTPNPVIEQFPCHVCPKTFSHMSGLSRHLSTHTGLMYQCLECERKFVDRSSIKRHVQHVHSIEFDAEETLDKYIQKEVSLKPDSME